jgi:hypothetical protein
MDNNFILSKSLVKISVVLFATLFIIVSFVSLVEDNIAIVILTFTLTIISIGFIFIIADRAVSKEMLMLSSIFILFYVIHMLSLYYIMMMFYNQWQINVDENRYFTNSIIAVSGLIDKGASLLNIVNIYEYSETALYLYIQGYLALLSNYIDHTSVLTQKLFNVFISALIPTVLFCILANIISKKEAFYAAIVYGFLSFNLAYSFPLLRDGFGAFLYIMIFYFYLLPSSNKNFIFIIIFAFLSYFLRPETGMYALLIAATYMYFQYNTLFSNKVFLRFMAFFILLPSIIFLIYQYNMIGVMTALMDRSLVHNINETSSGSLGAALLNLPIVIKLPLKLIHGQILYFPPWSILYSNSLQEVVFFRFFEFIASISWPHVWPFILIGIFKDKLFKFQDKEKLYVLFILSIIYLALSGIISSLPRKLMYVYPVIFMVATVSYLNMNIVKRKKIIHLSILVYLILIGLYITLKYLR